MEQKNKEDNMKSLYWLITTLIAVIIAACATTGQETSSNQKDPKDVARQQEYQQKNRGNTRL